MRTQFFLSAIGLCALFLMAVPHGAQAYDTATAVARMDAIIKEMQALRVEFETLSAAVPAAPSVPAGAVLGSSAETYFTMSLEPGETNADIKKIQQLLATDPEIYPYGVTSGFFGPKTEEGIKNFQARFGLKQVGVVGPATRALLELFITTYPDGNYPKGVLEKKPQVLGASTSVPAPVTTPTPAPVVTTTPGVPTGLSKVNPLLGASAIVDDGEAEVKLRYRDGTDKTIVVSGDTDTQLISAISDRIKISKEDVDAVFISKEGNSSDNSDGDIDSIVASVEDGETSVKVKYDDGEKDSFTVDEDQEDDIIGAVADELDMDESDVEDVIEFKYQDVDEINVDIKDGKAKVTVVFEDGTKKKFTVNEEDEDDIISAIADELDEDESDVEDWTDFNNLD